MENILNSENDFDINIFDNIVLNSIDPESPEKDKSEEILIKFKNQNTSWTKVDFILKSSKLQQSHYVALQILGDSVKTKWYILDDNMKDGLKNYVFQLVIEKTQVDCPDYILKGLNSIIVEMAKRDWPKRWPNLISDLINASNSISMDVCKNTLEILQQLNEDIFVNENTRITTARRRLLKNQMKSEFSTIFMFIKMIFEYSTANEVKESLLKTALSTFASLCSLMSYDFIFLTNIVELICGHLNSAHGEDTLLCLIEIINLGKDKKNFTNIDLMVANEQKVWFIFCEVFKFIELYIKRFEKQKIHEAYKFLEFSEKTFIYRICQLFSSIIDINILMLESKNIQTTRLAIEYLLKFSKIEDEKNFAILFEMWEKFVFNLYSEFPFTNKDSKKKLRRCGYEGILNKLLQCLVIKMPRPEEVFIVVNEYGEITKDKLIETEQINFYKRMRSCFYNLAFLIEDDLKIFFISKTGALLEEVEWSWTNVNKLCWSIGCVSGAFTEENEREFFVSVLKYLLVLCEMKHSKADKAVVASNIMFIIGQFHRFLQHNKNFLKTVLKKLFEFMDETHQGVKEMACDNFYKIAERCPREFLLQREENMIFLQYVLQNIKTITQSLDFYQKRFIYEALLLIIKEIPKNNEESIINNINKLMMSVSDIEIFSNEFLNSLNVQLKTTNTYKLISHVIRSHALIYKFIPSMCEVNYERLFPLYFNLFDIANNLNLSSEEPNVIANSKALKTNLVEIFMEIIESGFVKDSFITMLCEKIIFDYKNNPRYKDPSIILLGTNIIKKISKINNIQYIQIEIFFLSSLIEPSISYVMNADDHPDIAENYLRLIDTGLDLSFNTFYSNLYNSSFFATLYNSILHTLICESKISELCLKVLHKLFKKCFETNQMQFFTQNFVITLENILGIIFDVDTKHSFILQSTLLALMFDITKSIPSLDSTNPNNILLSNHIKNLFIQNFPNITSSTLDLFIQGLFELCKKEEVFREHLEDFAVKIGEFGTDEDLQDEVDILKERILRVSE